MRASYTWLKPLTAGTLLGTQFAVGSYGVTTLSPLKSLVLMMSAVVAVSTSIGKNSLLDSYPKLLNNGYIRFSN